MITMAGDFLVEMIPLLGIFMLLAIGGLVSDMIGQIPAVQDFIERKMTEWK